MCNEKNASITTGVVGSLEKEITRREFGKIAIGTTAVLASSLFIPFNAEAGYQSGWTWCHKCEGLFFDATNGRGDVGSCPSGGRHENRGSGKYTLIHESAPSGTQAEWWWCNKCEGLFFQCQGRCYGGVCPAGGSHSKSGSGKYALYIGRQQVNTQEGWRWCKKCEGLFFGANGRRGRCAAGGSHTTEGSGNYYIIHN